MGGNAVENKRKKEVGGQKKRNYNIIIRQAVRQKAKAKQE
jgi:hypothetical protein